MQWVGKARLSGFSHMQQQSAVRRPQLGVGQRSSPPQPLTPYTLLKEQVGALLRFFLPPLDPGTRALGAPSSVFHRGSGPVPTGGGGAVLFCSPALETAPAQTETHSCRAMGWSREMDSGKRAWPGSPNLASPWQLAGPV